MSSFVEIKELSKSFTSPPTVYQRLASAIKRTPSQATRVYAVNSVNMSIDTGEILGLVGESGCGKSTLGRMVAGILPPTAGEIRYEGRGMVTSGTESVYRKTQMVFQNPYASLNPRLRVHDTLTEAAIYRGLVTKKESRAFSAEILRSVGLDPSYADRYPHQFSGGQRQRIAIARALSMNPSLIVCDEAVSALDVSVQAQILNLFLDLRESRKLTYLFISHNLSVVEYLADRVAIMYLGRVVEVAKTKELFESAQHPYTKALIADAPRLDAKAPAYRPIQGELPSPLKPPSGCTFHPRCPHAMPRCSTEVPAMREISSGHLSACHLNDSATVRVVARTRNAA